MRVLALIAVAVLVGAILWRPDAPRVPWCVAGALILMWAVVMGSDR